MTIIKNVSDTAFMVAVWRARESERPNALFRDPLAGRLAGAHGQQIVDNLPKGMFMSGWSVVIRTCVIDDLIRSAIAEGIDTVVNLGCGLDTRPYRLELPASLQWIEADFPHVIDFKERELAGEKPRCRLERVRVDLADDAQRERFLSEVAKRSPNILVLTEGVVLYLNPQEVTALARDLRSRPAFRYWIVDYFSPESYAYRRRSGMNRALKNAPFRFEPTDYFGFFEKLGWRPKAIRYLAEEGDRLKRPMPLPLRWRLALSVIRPFLSAKRRTVMQRFVGYVLFEPATIDP